ncbi:hypothetical protein [Pseudonocardia acidicola]|uniref:Uncharacterized protein n=1 Tax=Pseudonocardia acidicola TaxID=2724939 RepID=A0ABX1S806_9PSEU|nr:hypothetical protein [Pseudonocardia acidicola]NMH96603.1 hypothetical protein [Pseudonocardia acidicola]
MTCHDRKIEVRVLRGSCADDETCPAITDIGDPAVLYFVGEPTGPGTFRLPASFAPELPAVDGWVHLRGALCSDQALTAAHAGRVADHERLYQVPLHQIPDALRVAVSTDDDRS